MKNNQVVSLFAAVAILGIPIMVIVNAANPVDNLSLGELKKLFLSESQPLGYRKSGSPRHAGSGHSRTHLFPLL
jgi:hypothetical protein